MNKENQKGITLIALIITIIVMLILVVVAVRTVSKSGLFGYAKDATSKWADAENKEANLGDNVDEILTQYTGGAGNNQGETGDDPGGAEDNPGGTELSSNPLGGVRVTENTEYKSNGKTAIIPAKFTPSGLSSEESIDGGLVIYLIPEGTTVDWTDPDEVENAQRTYDQFVWIPIVDINDMYMCQSEDGTRSCKITVENGKAKCTTHNSELMAGRLYATSENENFDLSLTTQTYDSKSVLHEPGVASAYDRNAAYLGILNSILGTSYGTADHFKDALQEEYNEIVKSVYENGGFYIGRYETSNITTTKGTSIKVVAGVRPTSSIMWYYMYAQQRDYANNNNLTVGSTMIQGAAYDQVMKFVNTESYDVKGATNVGHTSIDFTTEPYQTGGRDYSSNYSGTIEYNDESKNIFDLEGNVEAWTTETDGTSCRIRRGGVFCGDDSASYRNGYTLSNGMVIVGTVSQLYVK